MNFIISLFIYSRFDRKFEHIIIIMNKLFKKKIHLSRFFKNKNNNINIHRINLTKEKLFIHYYIES